MIRRQLALLALCASALAAPMDGPTRDAAERLISAAKVHPLVLVVPGDKVAKAEAVVREAMASGLTAEQVADLRSGLDTPDERAQAAAALRSLGSEADSLTVLAWVVAECSAPQVAPAGPSAPVAAGPFDPRIALPMLTYSWPQLTAGGKVEPMLDGVGALCDELGIRRGEVAFTVETHSDGGRPGAGVNWKEHWSTRVAQVPALADAIASRGFGTVWYVWNDNTPGKGYSKTWNSRDMGGNWAAIEPPLRAACGRMNWSRAWASFCNEGYDTGLDVKLRGLARDLGVPSGQLMYSDEPSQGARWKDNHIKDVHGLSGFGQTDVVTSDNGGSIRQLYGAANLWNSSGRPDVAAHVACLDSLTKNGGRMFFYSLATNDLWAPFVPEWRAILTRYAKLRGATPQAHPGPVAVDDLDVSQVEMSRGERECLSWPIETHITGIDAKAGDGAVTYHFTPRPNWSRVGSGGVDANPVIIYQKGGKWWGETHEWTTTYTAARDKRDCPQLKDRKHGETVYFMIAAICRNGERSATKARSQVFRVVLE